MESDQGQIPEIKRAQLRNLIFAHRFVQQLSGVSFAINDALEVLRIASGMITAGHPVIYDPLALIQYQRLIAEFEMLDKKSKAAKP